MPQNRYYTSLELKKNKLINISEDEFIHLARVMRKKKGDIVEIINGANLLAIGRVETISKNEATILVTDIDKKESKKNKTAICIPFLKQSKLDLIIEKATELNISEIILYYATHSEIKELSENKIARLERIIISAVKQCGRLDIPKVTILKKIDNLKNFSFNFYYGDIEGSSFSKKETNQSPICFIVGPEKGFTAAEKSFFKNQLKASSVTINSNILRVETAAICAATLLNSI